MRNAVHNLQHDLSSRSVRNAPMSRRGTRVGRHHMHRSECLFYLIHRLELRQHPRYQLQIGQNTLTLSLIVRFITTVVREVKQTGSQSGLVQPVGHKILQLHGYSYITVCRRKFQSVFLSARHIRLLHIPPRHNHITAVQITAAPLYGTSQDSGAVLRLQRNSRTCISSMRNPQPDRRNGKPENHVLYYFIHILHLFNILYGYISKGTKKAILLQA